MPPMSAEYMRSYRDRDRDHARELSIKHNHTYREKNHEKCLQSWIEDNLKRTFSKRCPECNKKVKINKNYLNRGQKYAICKNVDCRLYNKYSIIKISRTLSSNPNHDNVGGVRLKVVS